MVKFINLAGQKFGRLTVVKFFEKRGHNTYWLCKCDCGNEKIICKYSLTSGKTKSCGCLNSEISRKNHTSHNLSKTRIYNIWVKMKSRCLNSNDFKFKNYGGRGILICDEWKNDFKTFYDWSIANGYADNLTIDRIDNNGNYEPKNCRWATAKEQANNKRNNKRLTYNNMSLTVSEWSNLLNLPTSTIESRIYKHHWSVQKALSTR